MVANIDCSTTTCTHRRMRVFELLGSLEMQTTASFDVILERDGHYPSFKVMLEELERARAALNQVHAHPVRRYA